MRKLFWQISTTLDGFMEGPNHELEDTAQIVDPDFDRYASAMLQSIDAIVLGRVTYQLFGEYWPSATGPDAERMNSLPKIVCSRTLRNVEWNNSRLIRGDVVEEIRRLKQEQGRDIRFRERQPRFYARQTWADRRVPYTRIPGDSGAREPYVQGTVGSDASKTFESRGVVLRGHGPLLRGA